MASPLGYEPEVWRLICTEMGWPALIIPEEYGGAGGTYVDLAAMMEECGSRPAVRAAALDRDGDQRAAAWAAGGGEGEYLPEIAAGELTATAADLFSAPKLWRAHDQIASPGPSSVDGATAADLLNVLALDDSLGVCMTAVHGARGHAGHRDAASHTMDQTRRLGTVELHDVRTRRRWIAVGPLGLRAP